MLFNVEQDTGAEIVGYLIPDGFSGTMHVRVVHEGRELLRKETDSPRPAVAAVGRHETGLCGFSITDADLPGLAGLIDLELREAQTDVLIYRRCDPDAVVQKRILRLETHLLPSFRIDKAIGSRFQFFFPSVDRFSIETVWQTFLISNSSSVYISGRLYVRTIDQYLDDTLEVHSVLQDPFVELAERLLLLRTVGDREISIVGMRDLMLFRPATLFAASLSFDSDRELKRAFRDIDPDARVALSDPVVRQLTARLPNELAKPSAVREALSTLSNFKQVGLRNRAELFSEGLCEALGLPVEQAPPAVTPILAAEQLADRLRQVPAAEALIEHDLTLYHHVVTAFERALVPEHHGIHPLDLPEGS